MVVWVNYAMVYMGAALMVYNIYGFVQFARNIRSRKTWNENSAILYVPIVLLVMFLLGYLAVAILGQPDLIIAGILFGGSIFVFIMYKYLSNIVDRLLENERLASELMAAEESNKAKAQFLATMSHEMRTPLNVILGMDELVLKDESLHADTRERLEKIDLSAKHLLGLINNLLDMNRVETGMLSIENEEFVLSDMLDQVNAIAFALCEEKGLSYEVQLPEGDACHLVGDETQIKRVLISILDNAVKYTEAPGTVGFIVERTPEADGFQTIRFTVTDTGIGMDDDFIPKVFEMFSQEDTSNTNQYGGTGSSLSLAKNFVELMGGSIDVRSKKNEGSSFVTTIRLASVEPSELSDMHSDQVASESLEGIRVLIVEDLPENAEIVADLLELEGVESDHAENGQIALDMMKHAPEWHYDAILMDLRMPVMDGLEATRNIRALERADAKAVPIIALTANASDEDKRKSLESGMDAHLAKPSDADTLYAALRQFARKSTNAGKGAME